VSVQKREKQLKSISMSFILLLSLLTVWVLNDSYFWIISLIDSDIHKRKKPSSPYMDNAVKAARSKPSKPQLRSGCFIFNIAFLVCCAYIMLAALSS